MYLYTHTNDAIERYERLENDITGVSDADDSGQSHVDQVLVIRMLPEATIEQA